MRVTGRVAQRNVVPLRRTNADGIATRLAHTTRQPRQLLTGAHDRARRIGAFHPWGGFHTIGAQLRQPGRQGAELQLAEQFDDRFAVIVADVAAVEIDLDWQIAHDRRQPLTASGLVDPRGQGVPGPRRSDLVEVGDDRLDVAVLRDQRLGRLLANTGDTGYVVRGVADQRLVIGDVLGSKTVTGPDRGRVEVAQIAEALGSR